MLAARWLSRPVLAASSPPCRVGSCGFSHVDGRWVGARAGSMPDDSACFGVSKLVSFLNQDFQAV